MNLNVVEAQEFIVSYIVLFPLLGALLTYLIGRKTPALAGYIATGFAFASAIASTVAFVAIDGLSNGIVWKETLFSWMQLSGAGGLSIDFALRYDALSALMCLIVTWIGSFIHLYSVGYMAEDPSRARFFSYLNLFLFSMLVLVLGSNLLVLFVGWEGVGLCSYLLIGFWHKNAAFASAGRKAFVINRIGDAGVLLAIFLCLIHFGTLDFIEIQEAIGTGAAALPVTVMGLIALFLFVGATGKSAQIPLFVWLPDAMAGPTPVSALIHAATMVTAGIYLMARMFYVFDASPHVMAIIAIIALATAFVAATTALVQNDIKKVLAYSTVSQLGFMFLAAACGAYWVAMFHVVTHAFFKACLFLGAGSVIHGCHHDQDMRKMGGLRKLMPITFATYLIATLAIAGIYPFAGYQSKHAIMEALGAISNPFMIDFAWLLVYGAKVTAFLTAFYMARSLAMTFFGEYRGDHHPHESPWTMWIPLVVLAALSLFGGYLLEGPWSLQNFLAPVVGAVATEVHTTSFVEGILGSFLGAVGVAMGILVYTSFKEVPGRIAHTFSGFTRLFASKWYFDEMYDATIVRPLERLSRFLWRGVDQGIIDGSVNGTATMVGVTGWFLARLQTGQLRHYLAMTLFFSVLITLLYIVW